MPVDSHYLDDAVVAKATEEIIAITGSKVMQIHRFDQDDRKHVERLIELFDPDQGSSILSLACGVGEVERIMHETRPDLRFTLNNISPYQLSKCPEGMPQIQGDMHTLPVADGAFDCVLLCYGIGHANATLLKEISRVLRPGGCFFIYDLFQIGFPSGLPLLKYGPWEFPTLAKCAHCAGLIFEGALSAPRIIPSGFLEAAPPGCLNNTLSYAASFVKV